MKLVHADGSPVEIGQRVMDFRGKFHTITYIGKPHSPASTGRICTDKGAFYPSVFKANWIEREDQQ